MGLHHDLLEPATLDGAVSRRYIPLLVVAAAGLFPTVANADFSRNETRPSTISSYGSYLAWSSYDARRSVYRLYLHDGRRSAPAAGVRPRKAPFDVDLGPDAHGRPVAVYSRCRVEPYEGEVRSPFLWWYRHGPWDGRGCDVYRYDLGKGRERRARGASSRGWSEYLPSIWGTRLVFARRNRQWVTELRLRARRTGRSKALPEGQGPDDPGTMALDLRGRRLVFYRRALATRRHCGPLDPEEQDEGTRSQLWSVDVVTKRKRLLSSHCTRGAAGGPHRRQPRLSADAVHVLSSTVDGPVIERLDPESGRVKPGMLPAHCVHDHAPAARGSWVMQAELCDDESESLVLRLLRR